MPFRFAWICDLLESLEDVEMITPKLPPRDKQKRQHDILRQWFRTWGPAIRSPDTNLAAVLSTLFPERRTDRVYELQANRLLSILSRALGLGNDRRAQLRSWKTTKSEDLASFTARLVRVTDGGPPSPLTIEQIDSELEQVAARRRFSSPAVRSKVKGSDEKGPHEILRPVLRQLPSKELKWFIRLVLKNYAPVILDEIFVLRQIHFLLPRLLQFQSTFEATANILRDDRFADVAGIYSETKMTRIDTPIRHEILRPAVGVKIGRPTFIKARSLKQCLQIVQSSRWSIEPKYDGEYAQVHIDLSKAGNPIQIFAKNGKDATNDRAKLHEWIWECLRLDAPNRRFKQKCILEGEMIVYDRNKSEILPFHKIRKHCSRSGFFLGTENDSQAHPHERLIMVFYDCLLVDEEVTMALAYSTRRQRLHQLLHDEESKKTGKKPLENRSNWAKVDFSKHGHTKCTKLLEKKLAEAIAGRCEGLILKPVDSPYFSLDQCQGNAGKIIKLKKDYIQGLGDSADFAIIGARRDPRALGTVTTQWTQFTIATLENREAVLRFGNRPIFRIADALTRPCISVADMEYLAQRGAYGVEHLGENQRPSFFDLVCSDIDAKPEVVFKKPFIVDVLGSGFDKPASRNYWMLRHPRVAKVHGDRGLEDIVSFDELQEMAAEATNAPVDAQADQAAWRQKIETMSKPKRQPLTPRSPATTTTSGSITESIGTNMNDISTPTRTPRLRAPVAVRMDSMEMRPGDERHMPAETTSHGVASPHVVLDQPPAPTTAIESVEEANPKQKSKTPRQAITHVLQRPAQPPTAAARSQLRGGATPTIHSGTTYAKRSRTLDKPTGRPQAELKRARTVSEASELRQPPCLPSVASRTAGGPMLTTAASMPPRVTGAPSGNAGESQALFYSALPQLDGASNVIPARTQHSHTVERSSPPPLPTNPAMAYESVFSAPWNDVRVHLLRSSSPIPDPSAVSSSSPRRSAYMTPPSMREEAPAAAAYQSKPDSKQERPTVPDTDRQHRPNAQADHRTVKVAPVSGVLHTSSDFVRHLKSSTVFLPPSTSSHNYLSSTLLPLFKPAHTLSDLSHWRRELAPSTPVPHQQQDHPCAKGLADRHWHLPSQVAESQALPGLQKVMLVEARMKAQMQQEIDELVASVPLVRNDAIEVWDWRVLEDEAVAKGLLEVSQPEQKRGHLNAMDDMQGQGLAQAVPLEGLRTEEPLPPSTWKRRYRGSIRWDQSDGRNVWEPALKRS